MEYKGLWKSMIYCSRCGKFRPRNSKRGDICIDCIAINPQKITRKKEKVIKSFMEKYKIPHSLKPSYLKMLDGKILMNRNKGFSPVVTEIIDYLNREKSDEIKKVGYKLLKIENDWRISKGLKPIERFKDVSGKTGKLKKEVINGRE